MKIIIAATPATGHVDPVLGIGRLLLSRGHEVVVYTGSIFRERVERMGARFHPLPAQVDFDLRDLDACFPGREGLTGAALLDHDFKYLFAGPIPAQFTGLKDLLEDFPADVVIAEHLFLGALPLVFGALPHRPRLIGCGITFLALDRADGIPHGLGLRYVEDASLRAHYESSLVPEVLKMFAPLQDAYEIALSAAGAKPQGMPMSAMAAHADYFWQAGVPEIEFPVAHMPDHVRFIGCWPQAPNGVVPPAWQWELYGRRKVVLVTQGTIANADLDALVLPTMRALAGRDDLLVLGTTGGRPLPIDRASLPANARLEEYLPFDWLMPKISALVSNGGFGTVIQALAQGIPLVVAGASEDKPDIAARVEWAGAGINLGTDRPSEAALASAVDCALTDPDMRAATRAIAQSFTRHQSTNMVLATIDEIDRMIRHEKSALAG